MAPTTDGVTRRASISHEVRSRNLRTGAPQRRSGGRGTPAPHKRRASFFDASHYSHVFNSYRMQPMSPCELQVTENVYVVSCSEWNGIRALTKTAGSANVFLLDGGSEMALFDTGSTAGAQDLLNNVQSLGLDLKKIRKIVLTHSHWDHCNATAELLKALDCTVYGHALARETLAGRQGIYQPDY